MADIYVCSHGNTSPCDECRKLYAPAPRVDDKRLAEAAKKIADEFYFTDQTTLDNHKGDKQPIINEIAEIIRGALSRVAAPLQESIPTLGWQRILSDAEKTALLDAGKELEFPFLPTEEKK